MDDELVQRWRSGDERAETTVREHIRSIAGRVLSQHRLHGALGVEAAGQFRNPGTREAICDQLAQELMERQAGGAARLQSAALMRSLQIAVERLQSLPGRPGDVHLPPQILVTLGVASEGLGRPMKEASQRHLADCPICRGDLALVREIGAFRLQKPGDQGSAHGGSRSRAREPRLISSETPESGSRTPSSRLNFREQKVKKSPRRLLSLWPLIGVAAIAIWLIFSRDTPPDPESLEGVAKIADLTPPSIQRLSELPPGAQLALRELSKGQCNSAASRLRDLREAHPDEPRLYLLEGASFVCAADGRRALLSFEDLERAVEERGLKRPRQVPWYRAQAQLLVGDAEGALESLSEVDRVDARHRVAARKQAREIETSQMR